MKVIYKNISFKGEPELVKSEIDSLIAAQDGNAVTPTQIVEAAENPESELHKCFTWDDTVAARKWRLQEARLLVCNLVVVDDAEEAEQVPIRYYFKTGNDEGYKKTSYIISNADEYKSLLTRALGELKAFKTKYSTLAELRPVFDAIDEI